MANDRCFSLARTLPIDGSELVVLDEPLHLLDLKLADSVFLFPFFELSLKFNQSVFFILNLFVPLLDFPALGLFLLLDFVFDDAFRLVQLIEFFGADIFRFLLTRRDSKTFLLSNLLDHGPILLIFLLDLVQHFLLIVFGAFLFFLLLLKSSDLVFPDSEFVDEASQPILVFFFIC